METVKRKPVSGPYLFSFFKTILQNLWFYELGNSFIIIDLKQV